MPLDTNNLTAVLGPVTGIGSRTFTITASTSMSLTMGCIGKGYLMVIGPLPGSMICGGPDGAGVFSGYYWGHLRMRPGERIKLRVVAGAKTTWDIRVDGVVKGVEPPP